MADVTFSVVTGNLASFFEDAITTQLNRSVPLAAILPVTPGQGKNVQWEIRTGTATGAAIADGADVSTFNSDDKTPAVLQYAIYHDAFAITGLAAAAAAAARNPAELANLFMEELGESVTRVAAILGSHLYTGDAGASPGQLAGLVHATNGALKATGTYATINKASVTQFQGNELLNGGVLRPLSFTLLNDADRAAYDASGFNADLYVAGSIQFEKLALLFQTERRYVQEVTLASGRQIKLDGGVNILEWKGRTFMQDRLCPQDKILGLATQYISWKQLPAIEVGRGASMGDRPVAGTAEYQLGQRNLPLTVKILPLAITGDKYKFALYVYTQVQVKRPNACFILGDLAS